MTFNSTKIVAGLMVVVLTSSAASAPLFAQPPAPAQPAEPIPASDGDVITFEDENIEVDREGLRDRVARMDALLRDADGAVMDYLRDSTAAVQEGHRRGIAEYRVWYRNWEHAQTSAANPLILSITRGLFSMALNFIFPEASAFITIMKFVARQAFSAGISALQPSRGDVNLFLDQLDSVQERYIEGLLNVPQEFRTRYPDEFEAARWEYVFNVQDTTVLPPAARNYLRSVGVMPPGAQTSRRVSEEILTEHIQNTLSTNEMTVRGLNLAGISMRVAAQIAAYRQLGVERYRLRICRLERSNMTQFFWSVPRGQCPGE